MNDEQAFLTAIMASPADNTNRLVYADWCDENEMPATAAYQRYVANIDNDATYRSLGERWVEAMYAASTAPDSHRIARYRAQFVRASWAFEDCVLNAPDETHFSNWPPYLERVRPRPLSLKPGDESPGTVREAARGSPFSDVQAMFEQLHRLRVVDESLMQRAEWDLSLNREFTNHRATAVSFLRHPLSGEDPAPEWCITNLRFKRGLLYELNAVPWSVWGKVHHKLLLNCPLRRVTLTERPVLRWDRPAGSEFRSVVCWLDGFPGWKVEVARDEKAFGVSPRGPVSGLSDYRMEEVSGELLRANWPGVEWRIMTAGERRALRPQGLRSPDLSDVPPYAG